VIVNCERHGIQECNRGTVNQQLYSTTWICCKCDENLAKFKSNPDPNAIPPLCTLVFASEGDERMKKLESVARLADVVASDVYYLSAGRRLVPVGDHFMDYLEDLKGALKELSK
jgi:hypothetical protein